MRMIGVSGNVNMMRIEEEIIRKKYLSKIELMLVRIYTCGIFSKAKSQELLKR